MRYVSTRGEAPELDFEDVLLTGLARDGGLYVPAQWPRFSTAELVALSGKPYADLAFAVMAKFTGEAVPHDDLKAMISDAYASFGHKAVTPLKQLDADQWLLELFHGPTLAFKDVAMQFLARVMDWALARRSRRATIVGATSGDTGGAAIEAFKSSRNTSIFILHPQGKVSEVQRRQMTTVLSPQVHNIALRGTFDDCQAILKVLFNDHAFRDEVALAGVNSINWARIMAQIVYYLAAALALASAGRPANFTVPTGNFGDIFAGLVAKRLGAPIGRLVIATNENDILDRTLKTGRYEVRGVKPSSSPSMDIQVSSNFERLLFEAYGRDAGAVRGLMAGLSQSGAFTIEAGPLAAIRSEFTSGTSDMAETAGVIARTLAETGELLDPHTAVGYKVARQERGYSGPMITLATAHPAKFPDAVAEAANVRPGLPPRLAPLMMAEERVSVLDNDAEAVKAFIRERVKG
ncbi:threonine synthase [Taklimakanibacter lacteus]|uniref:threonine synthase n=1 Tax=Taklimakanibacter lacteus TaxID=2268456 RepID=UPI000E671D3A